MKKIKCNKIHCKICNVTIESKNVHDYVECCSECHCFVDGGHEYLRRGWNPKYGNPEDVYIEMSEYEEVADAEKS